VPGKYYAITLNAPVRPTLNAAIEAALSRYDWLRFSNLSYYIYANDESAESIYNLIKPLFKDTEHLLVVEVLASHRHGWASPVAVEWFSEPRS